MLKSIPAISAIICLTAVILSITGCKSQTTIADLVAIVGTSIANLEAVEGNTAAVSQIQTDTATATKQVLAWKSGSATTGVIAALNLVEDDLNLLPVSPQDQALVDLAIGTVDEILSLVPSTPASPVTSATVAHNVVHRQVHLAKTPKDAASYTKTWNKLATQNHIPANIK